MRYWYILVKRFEILDSNLSLFLVYGFSLFFKTLVLLPYIHISTFLVRDINRAKVFWEKGLVFFGPDTTSGYYLPGPFYTLILAPIVRFTESLEWIIVYHFVLNSLCYLFLSLTLRRIYSIPAWITYVLLAFSPFMIFKIFWVNNSTFIPGLVALFLAFFLEFVRSKKVSTMLWTGLILGLGVQLHGSITSLLVATFVFNVFFSEMDLLKKLRNESALIFGFFVPLLPYCWRVFQPHLPFHNIYTHRSYISGRLLHKFHWENWENFLQFDSFRVEVLIIYGLSFFVIFQSIYRQKSVNKKDHWELRKFLFILFPAFVYLTNILLTPVTPRYGFFLVVTSKVICLIVLYQRPFFSTVFRILGFAVLLNITWISVQSVWSPRFQDRYYTSHNDIKVSDARLICNYLKNKKVTRHYFLRNTYEILDRNQEDGLWLLKSCLEKEVDGNANDSSFFIVVARSIAEDSVRLKGETALISSLMPKGVNVSWNSPDLETANFFVFKVQKAWQQSLGNLTDSYILDPAIAVDFPEWSGLEEEIGFKESKLKIFKLCESQYFCDLYFYYKVGDSGLKVAMLSRLFQSRWSIPPLNAYTESITLRFQCDGEMREYSWPFSLGSVRGWRQYPPTSQNGTGYFPLFFESKVKCKSLQLSQLELKNVLFRFKKEMKAKDQFLFEF